MALSLWFSYSGVSQINISIIPYMFIGLKIIVLQAKLV